MRSTVISIYPRESVESKPGLIPQKYLLPAGHPKEPKILSVGDARYYISRALDQPPFIAIEPGETVAKALVEDFLKSQLDYTQDAHPGLMWIAGEVDLDKLTFKYAEELKALEVKQTRWLVKQVERADDEWNRYRHHTAITDAQRFAVEFLKLKRDWTMVREASDMMDCPACGFRIRATIPICSNCRAVINQEAASKIKFIGA